MGQKIHPTGLRLGITKSHLSRWYADVNRYGILAEEDHKIRKFIEKTLSNAGIADILIDRKADQVDLEIRTARPGVVVGRGGAGIEQLRLGLVKHLEQDGSIKKTGTSQVRINVTEVTKVDAEAPLIAEYIAQQSNVVFPSVVLSVKRSKERSVQASKGLRCRSVVVSTALKSPEPNGYEKVVFLCIHCVQTLTIAIKLPAQSMVLSASRFGFSKVKSLKAKKPLHLPPNPVVASNVVLSLRIVLALKDKFLSTLSFESC